MANRAPANWAPADWAPEILLVANRAPANWAPADWAPANRAPADWAPWRQIGPRKICWWQIRPRQIRPHKIKAKRVKVKMEKRQDKEAIVEHGVKEEKVEESCPGKEVSSSGSTNFTLRSFPTGANAPSTQPLPHGSCLPPSPAVSPPLLTPPLFTPPWIPFHQSPQFGQMPAANWVICGGCQMLGTVIPFWAAPVPTAQ